MGQNKTRKRGGKVIASGGFGCVFLPALKCKNKERNDRNITKLMIKRDALKEYNEITEIKDRIKDIKQFDDLFILDNIDICEIDHLTKSDKENFNKKCKPLKKDGITSKNINNKLGKMLALNLPWGGIPVDDYLFEHPSYAAFSRVNNGLINLLENGIIHMNKRNVFHSDIKDSNVLIDDRATASKLRLIDWGLSVVLKNTNEIPKSWLKRPLQFNVPFSNIMFSDQFIYNYDKFLNNGEFTESSLYQFVEKYLIFWKKERGVGHLKYIMSIVDMLDNNGGGKTEKNLEEEANTLITKYILKILFKFTNKHKSAGHIMNLYMNQVYKFNIDVWGLVTCYLPLIEVLHANNRVLSHSENELSNCIKGIIRDYLYNERTSDVKINTHALIKKMKHIQKMLVIIPKRKKNKATRKKHSKIS